MTSFKMETIFKLNLEDQVCPKLTTQGSFENVSSRSLFDGERQFLMEKTRPREQMPNSHPAGSTPALFCINAGDNNNTPGQSPESFRVTLLLRTIRSVSGEG